MKIEINKNFISEVIVRKKQVRLHKEYYAFLSMFGIQTIYMDNIEMIMALPHPKEVKHPDRAEKMKKLYTYYIHFGKKCEVDKFSILVSKTKFK